MWAQEERREHIDGWPAASVIFHCCRACLFFRLLTQTPSPSPSSVESVLSRAFLIVATFSPLSPQPKYSILCQWKGEIFLHFIRTYFTFKSKVSEKTIRRNKILRCYKLKYSKLDTLMCKLNFTHRLYLCTLTVALSFLSSSSFQNNWMPQSRLMGLSCWTV